jgi:hypothetical protein
VTLISQKYLADNDVVARYLADKLSAAERERFEAYYLEHPELLRELNIAAQFKSGLMDLNESGALGRLLNPRPWWQRARLAAAASLVVAAMGTIFWFNWQGSSRPLLASSVAALTPRFQSTLPIAGIFDIQRTRTSSYDATISLRETAAAIELHVKPEVLAAPALYRVSLVRLSADNSSTNIAEAKALQPAADGFVAIYLNEAALTPAIYELKISGELDTNAAKAESSFLIEVLAASDK